MTTVACLLVLGKDTGFSQQTISLSFYLPVSASLSLPCPLFLSFIRMSLSLLLSLCCLSSLLCLHLGKLFFYGWKVSTSLPVSLYVTGMSDLAVTQQNFISWKHTHINDTRLRPLCTLEFSVIFSLLLLLLPNTTSSIAHTHICTSMTVHSLFLYIIIIMLSHTPPHMHIENSFADSSPLWRLSPGALTTFPHGKLPVHTHKETHNKMCVMDSWIMGKERDVIKARERGSFILF